MSNERIIRSRVAAQMATMATARGDAPILIVPGGDAVYDMDKVVRDLSSALGYDEITQRTALIDEGCAFLAKDRPSALHHSERDRLYVLDDRAPRPPEATLTAEQAIARAIMHINAAGGIRRPIVVVSRFDAGGARAQARDLCEMTGLSSMELYPVL